jgi:putative flippase GtrA
MMLQQVVRFGFVGVIATLVHVTVGVTLIHSGWQALWANALSFAIAFFVSFMGHFGYSFADQQGDITMAFKRYAAVALCGFCLNEILLAGLLLYTLIPPMPALALTTLFSATLTFLLSRIWAFRQLDADGLAKWGDSE